MRKSQGKWRLWMALGIPGVTGCDNLPVVAFLMERGIANQMQRRLRWDRGQTEPCAGPQGTLSDGKPCDGTRDVAPATKRSTQ